MRFERMELDGTGNVRGTGEFLEYPVQAVYRAVGYFGSPLADVPFDADRGVIPHEAGRVLGEDGHPLPGVYATGWIKRGPVGLIGHTKGDALETVGCLLEDLPALPGRTGGGEEVDVVELLESRGVEVTSWDGWLRLDDHERTLGAEYGELPDGSARERVKVVERAEMVGVSRSGSAVRV